MNRCIIIGGGTFNNVACHLSLAAPAFGTTARQLTQLIKERVVNLIVDLKLTKMADYTSEIISGNDLQLYVDEILKDDTVKFIIFNVAVCDFEMDNPSTLRRLSSSVNYATIMRGVSKKILTDIKIKRPDIFVVGFKTTADVLLATQIEAGEKLLIDNNLDLVLANDIVCRRNILLSKSGNQLHGTREQLLANIVDTIVASCTR